MSLIIKWLSLSNFLLAHQVVATPPFPLVALHHTHLPVKEHLKSVTCHHFHLAPLPLRLVALYCFRKYPYPPHVRCIGSEPPPPPPLTQLYQKFQLSFMLSCKMLIWPLHPPTPLEFPAIFQGVGIDNFFSYTLQRKKLSEKCSSIMCWHKS